MSHHLTQCALPVLTKPVNPIIGLKPSGEFRTSAAKEYPPAMNKARAVCLPASGPANEAPHDLFPYGVHLSHLSASAERGTWLPDFQPDVMRQ